MTGGSTLFTVKRDEAVGSKDWRLEGGNTFGFLELAEGLLPNQNRLSGWFSSCIFIQTPRAALLVQVLRSCQHNCYTFSLFFDLFTTQKPRVGRILAVDANGAPPGLAMEPV